MTDFTDAQKNTKVLDIIKSITQAGNKKKLEEDQQFCQQLKARSVLRESDDDDEEFHGNEKDRLRHHEQLYRYHREEGDIVANRIRYLKGDLKKAYAKVNQIHNERAKYHAAQIHKLNKGLKD